MRPYELPVAKVGIIFYSADSESTPFPLCRETTMEIHVSRDGQQYGAYSLEQVRQLLIDGRLAPDDLGWRKGMAEWAPLGWMPEFAGQGPAAISDPPSYLYGTPSCQYPEDAATIPSYADTFGYVSVDRYADMLKYAGFWRRFLAYILDYIPISIVNPIVFTMILAATAPERIVIKPYFMFGDLLRLFTI
jgi:hypothetical protein